MRRAIVAAVLAAVSMFGVAHADEAEDKAAKLIEGSGGAIQRELGKTGKVVVATLGAKAGNAEVKALADFKGLMALTAAGPVITDAAAKEIAGRKTLTSS